jgi:hypothetical protein
LDSESDAFDGVAVVMGDEVVVEDESVGSKEEGVGVGVVLLGDTELERSTIFPTSSRNVPRLNSQHAWSLLQQ